MTAPQRVAVYGGSFNPPHVGHVFACAWALITGEVERVVVVPCFVHPFGKTLAAFDHRFAMAERGLGWLPNVTVSRVEAELGGESRTLRTVRHLHQTHPHWSQRLLIGADVLTESEHWYGFDELASLAPPLVIGRQGVAHHDALPLELPNVSSTDVRERLAAGESNVLRSIVPASVLTYIAEHGLYGNEAP